MKHRLISAVLILLLPACASSPPTRFFTLDPVPGSAPAAGGNPMPPVKVDAVHIPPALDRNSMVRGANGAQLQISSQDLASRLPAGQVIGPDAPAPHDARGIVVDIMTYQPQSAGEVVLDADWTLLEGTQTNPVLHRSVHLTTTAARTAQDEAAAMSRLLGELAERIAAAIRAGRAAAGS